MLGRESTKIQYDVNAHRQPNAESDTPNMVFPHVTFRNLMLDDFLIGYEAAIKTELIVPEPDTVTEASQKAAATLNETEAAIADATGQVPKNQADRLLQ